MINTNQKITFLTATQAVDQKGYKHEQLSELQLIGTVDTGSFRRYKTKNGDILTAGYRVILKGYEIDKFRQARPRYLLINSEKHKILGVGEYPNHIEVYA